MKDYITKQNRSTDGCSNPDFGNMTNSGETGLSIEHMQVENGRGRSFRRNKRPLLVSRSRYEGSIETSLKSVIRPKSEKGQLR